MHETEMTHELAVAQGRPLTVGEITAQSMVIHRILNEVMVEGIHYGKIPGTGDKPTLLQPGAEKLCVTFRLAPKYHVEDLSDPHQNLFRYRVACSLYTIQDGLFVGSAVGEASSAEEKYQWEKAVCHEHWDSTDPTRRRVKFKKKYGTDEVEQIEQVQANGADRANVCLKIACKRAFISATRGVTAASDLLEVDLDEEAAAELAKQDRGEQTEQPKPKPKAKEKPAPAFTYGKHKGQQITDLAIETGYLEFMADKIAQGLAEVAEAKTQGTVHARAKFAAQDQLFLAALDAEIAHRKQSQPQQESKQPQEQVKPAPGTLGTEKLGAPIRDSLWADLVLIWEEAHLAEYQATKQAFKVSSAHDLPADQRQAFKASMDIMIATK